MEQLVDRRGSRFFLWSTSFLFFLLLLFGSPLSPPFPKSQSVSISIPTSPTTTTDTTAPPLPLVLFPPAQVSHSQFVSSSILSPCPRPPLPFFASPLPLPASRESLSALGRRERQYTRQYLVQVGKVENNVSTSVEVK